MKAAKRTIHSPSPLANWRSFRWLGVLLLFGLWAAAGLPASPALARQVTLDGQCRPVDVVVLIDQSDSMANNDPNGERFRAAQTIIKFLGNHAVWLCQGEDVVHRVSVIGFGDDPTQPLNTQSPNPYQDDIATYIADQNIPPRNTFVDWKEDREAILAAVDGANGDYLGATDHVAGLQAARERLDLWRAAPLGDRPRRQSVILITDGEPCLFAFGCPYQVTARDMDAVVDLTDPGDAQFPWRGADHEDSVFMSLIAMSRRGSGLQFSNTWAGIMQGHGGDIFNANDLNTNLSTIVTDIISPIAGSALQPVDCNEEFWVNPYIDNLVLLYAFGLDDQVIERATVVIDTLDGQVLIQGGTPSSTAVTIQDYVEDDRNEFYVFRRPLPGRYHLTYTGQSQCIGLMDVRVGNRAATGEVVTPAADASYPALDPPSPIAAEKFRVAAYESVAEVTVTDSGEAVVSDEVQLSPLMEIDGYPLQITAAVASQDGAHRQRYDFVKVEDGIYESTEVIASPVAGAYDWEVIATVRNPNPDGQLIEVFRDSGRFTATEVIPFGFAITSPTDGVSLPLNTVSGAQQTPEPIPVTIDLLDSDGNPASIDTYLTATTDLFTASLLKGDTIIETVPLTRAPGSASAFTGQLTNSVNGNVSKPGEFVIEVRAAWSPDKYDPLVHQPALDRAAIGISQFEVVPLDLRINGPTEAITLHQDNWLRSLRGEIRPVDFTIEIVNAVTQEPVALDDVLADLDGVYQAAVVPPSGNPVVAPLTVVSNENFQHFEAAGAATDVDEAGDYQIKLDTTTLPLRDNFAWAGGEANAAFVRQDTTFTNPTVWRIIAGVVVAALAALLGFLIYIMTGGPAGRLVLLDTESSSASEILQWKLSGTPRVNRKSSGTLELAGLKSVQARRAPKDDEGARGVIVSVVGTDGEKLVDNETLYEGDVVGVLPTKEIRYER